LKYFFSIGCAQRGPHEAVKESDTRPSGTGVSGNGMRQLGMIATIPKGDPGSLIGAHLRAAIPNFRVMQTGISSYAQAYKDPRRRQAPCSKKSKIYEYKTADSI
jgi:hypothetical protein